MKKIFLAVFIFISSCFLFACKEEEAVKDNRYYVDYEIIEVLYDTEDGTWNDASVENMITRYYDKKCMYKPVRVTITFKAEESFHYANFICKGGIGEETKSGLGFHYQVYENNIGQQNDEGTLFEAGVYEIIIEDSFFCFWKSRGPFLAPWGRDYVTLMTELEIIKYIEV